MEAIEFMTLKCDLGWVIDDDEDHFRMVCVVVVKTMNLGAEIEVRK